jgi:predicted nucleic acid-binding protein
MILVDTAVWIDHLRTGNAALVELLDRSSVIAHPWVIGELALGNLTNRTEILALLHGLPQATLARHDEVLGLIQHDALYDTGIGYVDAQLLAASRLTPDTRLWSTDKRLVAVATRLGLSFQESAWHEPR